MIAVMKTKHDQSFLFHDTWSLSKTVNGSTKIYTSDTTLIRPIMTNGSCAGVLFIVNSKVPLLIGSMGEVVDNRDGYKAPV